MSRTRIDGITPQPVTRYILAPTGGPVRSCNPRLGRFDSSAAPLGPRLSVLGQEIVNEERECPMCGGTKWILLDGHSTLQALEGGLEALAFSCDECGFIRWHRIDKAERA